MTATAFLWPPEVEAAADAFLAAIQQSHIAATRKGQFEAALQAMARATARVGSTDGEILVSLTKTVAATLALTNCGDEVLDDVVGLLRSRTLDVRAVLARGGAQPEGRA